MPCCADPINWVVISMQPWFTTRMCALGHRTGTLSGNCIPYGMHTHSQSVRAIKTPRPGPLECAAAVLHCPGIRFAG